jgi:hypothetical protein
MKKILYLLSFLLFSNLALFSQNTIKEERFEKLRDRINELVAQKLNLTKNESEKFSPIFVRYFNELRTTHREFNDPLVRQQKVAELRIRYRTEFKQVLDERRANRVFVIEKEVQEKIQEEIRDRREQRMEARPGGRKKIESMKSGYAF